MRLVVIHTRIVALEFVRYPSFIVPTLLFPALFFAFFAIPRADEETADLLLSSFVAFAFLGVAFFQFRRRYRGGATLAVGALHQHPPCRALAKGGRSRALGSRLRKRVGARSRHLRGGDDAGFANRGTLGRARGRSVVGSIPFAFLGFAIGYLASPKAVLPVANLLFLILAYLGGMWTGLGSLPEGIRVLSLTLPTRQWMEIHLGTVLGDVSPSVCPLTPGLGHRSRARHDLGLPPR